MTVLMWIGGVVLALVILAVVAYMIYQKTFLSKQAKRIDRVMAPIKAALEANQDLDGATVQSLVSNPEIRNTFYQVLKEAGKLDLFPAEYKNPISFAESNMAYWLGYPTELNKGPDEIELVKRVAIDSGTDLGKVDYYLFRFRTNPPHWAADEGWMEGVSGPQVRDRTQFLLRPPGTFSEMEKFEAKTTCNIIDYYHQKALKNGTYEKLSQILREKDPEAIFVEIESDTVSANLDSDFEDLRSEEESLINYLDRINKELVIVPVERNPQDNEELLARMKEGLGAIETLRSALSESNIPKALEILKRLAAKVKAELNDADLNRVLSNEIEILEKQTTT